MILLIMSNLVELDTNIPNQDVIESVEFLLDRAKSGELKSLAYVLSYGGYHTANGWTGMDQYNMAMIGELESLKIDLTRFFVEQRIEYLEIE